MAKKGKRKGYPIGLLLALVLALEMLGATVTGIIINSDHTWYNTLTQPVFAAPGWVSSEVWLVLYLFMGLALYVVYLNRDGKSLKYSYALFFFAAIIPVLRAFFFWQLHYLMTSTALIAVEWLLVIALTLNFWYVSKKASLLMLPVLLWLLFSLIVGISVLALNGIIFTI
jgi:tryptophan-rich sensory protein